MKKNLFNLFALLLAATFFNVAIAQTSSSAIVTVNGSKITNGQLGEWVSNAVSEGAKDTPELRQSILNDLILREAIAQDVKKTGLLNSGNNAFKLKVAQQNALLELWLAQYFKNHPLSEADVRTEYDKQVVLSKDPKNAKEYQISQIVVASQSEGEQIIGQINGGASFETLAKEKSLDKASGANGGLLGWALSTQLAAPINDMILTIPKGQISPKPIQTQNTWHIVKVNDIKPFVMPSFDQSKTNIAQALVQQRRQEAINELMKSVKVTKAN